MRNCPFAAMKLALYMYHTLNVISTNTLTVRGLFMVLSCRAFRQVELMLMSSSCEVSYSTTTGVSFCWHGSNVSISKIFPTANLSKEDSTNGWELNASRPGRRNEEKQGKEWRSRAISWPTVCYTSIEKCWNILSVLLWHSSSTSVT